jgi:hypothetical protein
VLVGVVGVLVGVVVVVVVDVLFFDLGLSDPDFLLLFLSDVPTANEAGLSVDVL